MLRGGANDLGGTLMEETISRMAGSENGSAKTVAELVAIAENLGLSGSEAQTVLEEGRFAAAVDADWARSRALGVTAVPTAVWKGQALVGFQPYAAFRQLVSS